MSPVPRNILSNGKMAFRSGKTNIVSALAKREWYGERVKYEVLAAAGVIAGPLLQAALEKPRLADAAEEAQGRNLALALALPIPCRCFGERSAWNLGYPLMENDIYYDALRVIVAGSEKSTVHEGTYGNPLHVAILRKNLVGVKCLLNSGVNPNISVMPRGPALHSALRSRYFRDTQLPVPILHESAIVCGILQLLLEAGADPTSLDVNGNTPMHKAARAGFIPELEVLLKAFQVTEESTRTCCRVETYSVLVDVLNSKGLTPIFSARNEETAKLLISFGACVHRRGPLGETLLHVMSSSGRQDVARLLISMGARIDARDAGGETPLHHAVQSMRQQMVRFLLSVGADVNASDDYGKTPLHIAAQQPLRSLADILIDAGAEVNAVDEGHNTPLHYWAGNHRERENIPQASRPFGSYNSSNQQRSSAVASALINSGATVNACNSRGLTPLQIATGTRRKAVLQELVRSKADMNARDATGKTVQAALGYRTPYQLRPPSSTSAHPA